ncbi:MAG: SAM-dependent methyltransferase [Clostridia bacterium]|nr:SAM-dependent methyltransferase [Clostridia bacterium]
MKLRPRLKMAADMVRPGSRFADIGTDHAYLPAWLILNGICPGGIASDLRKSPLENAAQTLKVYHIENKVGLLLSDGLDCISGGECDDIIFAGMGGTLITEILCRTGWIKDKSKRLIFQPMSHSEDVRKYLCENGFEIITESACVDDGRDYICFCAEYTGRINKKSKLYYFTGAHPLTGNDASARYYKRQLDWVKTRCTSLDKAGIHNDEYQYLKSVLDEYEVTENAEG